MFTAMSTLTSNSKLRDAEIRMKCLLQDPWWQTAADSHMQRKAQKLHSGQNQNHLGWQLPNRPCFSSHDPKPFQSHTFFFSFLKIINALSKVILIKQQQKVPYIPLLSFAQETVNQPIFYFGLTPMTRDSRSVSYTHLTLPTRRTV